MKLISKIRMWYMSWRMRRHYKLKLANTTKQKELHEWQERWAIYEELKHQLDELRTQMDYLEKRGLYKSLKNKGK